eukprot:COSAG05_NODE_7344_length_824_cov_1.377931_1_plen_224_part_10
MKVSDDIVRVKAVIQEREGIPPEQQSLYSACGQLLEDRQSLNDCGIRAESRLQLRLAGDAPIFRGPSRTRCHYGAMAAAVVLVALCVMAAVCTSSGSSTPKEPRGHTFVCESNPCENGRCTANGAGFTCACADGWMNTTCDQRILPTFNVTSGVCTLQQAGRCVGRPEGYGPNEACVITVLANGTLGDCNVFDTLFAYQQDYITVPNGLKLVGPTFCPVGVGLV